MKIRSILFIASLVLGVCQFSSVQAEDAIAIESKPDVFPKVVRTVYPTKNELTVTKGIASINVVINEKGRVHSAEILKCSDESLKAPLLKALESWRFKPATKDGKPCASRIQIPFRIDL